MNKIVFLIIVNPGKMSTRAAENVFVSGIQIFFTTQLSYEVRDCFFPIMRHNSPLQCHIRTVPEDELNNEMFMTLNGPEIGELDEILKTVLDLHFKNS